MSRYLSAVCQMDSQDNKQANLKAAGELIAEAAAKGAQLAVLPETMTYMGHDLTAQAEEIPGETSAFLCEEARRYGIWIAGGSFPETVPGGLPKNTMLLIGPDGKIRSSYSKIHMFDVDIAGGVSYRESDMYTPGSEITVTQTELGGIGMAICYDIRFGEMFRLMALRGAQLICVPASFTLESGKDHWETLLRARAIENGVYILAGDQAGIKTSMRAYGNSMIIDPWGRVIARSGEVPGVILAEIDTEYVSSVRRQIPSLKNRREDVYRLTGNLREREM